MEFPSACTSAHFDVGGAKGRRGVMKRTTVKRPRRTKTEMGELLGGVLGILGEYDEPISIRHLFYRCSGAGLIEKTEKDYGALRAHLVKWRRERIVPFDAFVDGTRYYYGCRSFDDLGEYLRAAAASYRLNLWRDSECHVEVWTEKDAIASAVARVVQEWNLQTLVCRGDASMSTLARSAESFNAARDIGRRPIILYLGDFDETGLAIPKTIERNLEADHDCQVSLIRVGVNEDHIAAYELPTRPPKGKRRGEEVERAVDIDALPPAVLRELISASIEGLIAPAELVRMKAIEEAERDTLRSLQS